MNTEGSIDKTNIKRFQFKFESFLLIVIDKIFSPNIFQVPWSIKFAPKYQFLLLNDETI